MYIDLLIIGLVLLLVVILTYTYEKKKDDISFIAKEILACATLTAYIVELFLIIKFVLHSLSVMNRIW